MTIFRFFFDNCVHVDYPNTFCSGSPYSLTLFFPGTLLRKPFKDEPSSLTAVPRSTKGTHPARFLTEHETRREEKGFQGPPFLPQKGVSLETCGKAGVQDRFSSPLHLLFPFAPVSFLLLKASGIPRPISQMEALVTLVIETGKTLVDRCSLVKQHHSEAKGVAQRALDAVISLEKASSEFSADVELEAKLIELKRTWEEARKLVEVSYSLRVPLVLVCYSMASSSGTSVFLRAYSCFCCFVPHWFVMVAHAIMGWSAALLRMVSLSSLWLRFALFERVEHICMCLTSFGILDLNRTAS